MSVSDEGGECGPEPYMAPRPAVPGTGEHSRLRQVGDDKWYRMGGAQALEMWYVRDEADRLRSSSFLLSGPRRLPRLYLPVTYAVSPGGSVGRVSSARTVSVRIIYVPGERNRNPLR